ncbi:phage minor tail protein domain-containing protein, partial [Escherichia coli]
MFLKTEQFEYNGVSVTLSELSALQRFDYIKFVSDAEQQETTAYSALFDHGLASKSDQRFASIRSTG